MKSNVLQNFNKENLFLEPFPYFYIENVLPVDVYQSLADTYPEWILNGQTENFNDFRYYEKDFDYSKLSKEWQEFIKFHTSKVFKDSIVEIFSQAIKKYYPKYLEKYLTCEVSPRHEPKPNTTRLEIQFVMNAINAKSIRTPHVDAGRELFACLFYMKKLEDQSLGGDLIIYKKSGDDFAFNSGRIAPVDQIEEVKRIPYKENTMIVFLNTPDSIHGVSQRVNASTIRRYVNIDAHVEEKLFKLEEK